MDRCLDRGGCSCGLLGNDDSNILSKGVYGVLNSTEYKVTDYSQQYALQLSLDESTHEIVMSDANIDYNGNGTTVRDLSFAAWGKLLLLTYLSFDKYTGKFIEQVVFSSASDNSVHEWRYKIGEYNCLYHNEDGCVTAEENFTDVTIYVEYVTGFGNFMAARAVYPALYNGAINVEDNKPKIDGVYKSYMMIIPDLYQLIGGMAGSTWLFTVPTYFMVPNGAGGYYIVLFPAGTSLVVDDNNFNFSLIINGETTEYDEGANNNASYLNESFSISNAEVLKNLRYIPNVLRSFGDSSIEPYYAEDVHLITYQVRDSIVESIKSCNMSCEKQTMDEWIGLMQKKKAAKFHICENNITEAARIMFTLTERCKSCK